MRPAGCRGGDRSAPWPQLPLIDRTDLAAVTGLVPGRGLTGRWPRLDQRRPVRRRDPRHRPLSRNAERFHLTAAGAGAAGRRRGACPLEELLRARPVSARWRRILLERLDALAP